MTKKELNAKLEVLEDNGIVSEIFLHTIGLDNGEKIVGNGKKVKCYRNYYCAPCAPKIIHDYIEKGYMRCSQKGIIGKYFYFEVTEEGFAWLSRLLNIKVEEED